MIHVCLAGPPNPVWPVMLDQEAWRELADLANAASAAAPAKDECVGPLGGVNAANHTVQ